jgi:hypothetical protein
VGTESFALQEYIFVNHDNIPHGIDITNMDDHKFWVARVLEIRAIDEAHVYLRVYWLYWPEELPGGRALYHGKKELIASNHMEIIDAMTVSGRANVKHWLELDDEEDLPDLFWRQKFDFPSGTLMVRYYSLVFRGVVESYCRVCTLAKIASRKTACKFCLMNKKDTSKV